MGTNSSTALQRTGGTKSRLSITVRGAGRLLRSQVWLWPLLAAVFLAVVGWWVQHSIERSMQRHYESQLQALLAVDVVALETWLKGAEEEAIRQARDREVRGGAIELVDVASTNPADLDRQLRDSPYYERVQQSLMARLPELGYDDFVLVDAQGRTLVNGDNQLIGIEITGEHRKLVDKILAGEALVSRPTRSLRVIRDGNELRTGLPVMFTGAPVLNAENKPIAALLLRMRPEGEFSQILRKATFGKSGETYAFNEHGLMLSQSRFDSELKRAGILPDAPDTSSVLTLELRDPGVNMMAGERPTLSRSEMPLTQMAQKAIGGASSVDVTGHRDYRGVPSIAASTWLPRYDFGLTTKIEYDEAYAPVFIVRRFIWLLLGLLGLGAVAIYVFMLVVHRQQRALQKAALAAKQLGQYTLEDKIGAGGMGTVYRARHRFLRRPTAVKLLDPEKMSDIAIARFEREVQLTSQLSHPNTIAVYDFGRTDEGLFYYVMELLEGMNLDGLVDRYGAQSEGRVVYILQQVCGSLAEAHAAGLIHRDIKPANIYLTVRGGVYDFAKVLDFGLARSVSGATDGNITAGSSLSGTPLYLAPEVIQHPDAADSRSDVYALGAVGYFLLTATTVFRSGTIIDILTAHVKETPQSPSERLGRQVDPELEKLVMRCLAKDPNERPPSAAAVLEELLLCDGFRPWTFADARKWWQQTGAPIAVTQTQQVPTHVGQVDQTVVLERN